MAKVTAEETLRGFMSEGAITPEVTVYDTEDGEALADEILKNVSDMMDGGDLYRYLRNSQISTL